jgi:hypothetical protein
MAACTPDDVPANPDIELRRAFAEDADFREPQDAVEPALGALSTPLGREAVRLIGDQESPCLRHLGVGVSAEPFQLDGQVLQRLVDSNRFGPGLEAWGRDLVLVGLRGCRLADDTDGFAAERDRLHRLGFGTDEERQPGRLPLWASTPGFVRQAMLVEDTITHVLPRCLIGVWRRSTGEFALVRGTTTPNWEYSAQAVARRAGSDTSPGAANMMLTGLYRFKVGPHKHIPDAFRLHDADHGAARVASSGKLELSYTVRDRYWNVPSWPSQNNIHPSMAGGDSATRYVFHYSAGCTTVQGSYDTASRRHSGAWTVFRGWAGLKTRTVDSAAVGRRFSYLLLTGREARMAATGVPGAQIARLRYGSRGNEIKALQSALGHALERSVPSTGRFDGPTQSALVAWQWTRGLYPESWDGILAPLEAAGLGLVLT